MGIKSMNKSIYDNLRCLANIKPNKIAIEYDKNHYTYFEVENNANYIGKFLIENVVDCDNICVLLDKGPLLVMSLIGILKCGKIFIPMNPNSPVNSLKNIIYGVESNWIISELKYLDKLNKAARDSSKVLNVIIDKCDFIDFKEYSNLNINVLSRPYNNEEIEEINIFNDTCYIYFTSGSSGKSKAVLGSQRSLKHFIDWEIGQFEIDESIRVSQLTTSAFDPFLRDIFVPLCSGGTICIPKSDEIIINPLKLVKWINEEKISLIHMVPTLFKEMIREVDSKNNFDSLKYILLAGELIKGIDLKRFYELFEDKIQLVNIYGPTETTLAKAFYLIDKKDINRINVPIGKAIDNAELVILDNELSRCRQGQIGEIYIRTPYMSLGYYNNQELNAKAFLKDPFSLEEGGKIYKTGDLGKVLEDGNIECLGRIDNQVKIRGMKVDLSEIEKVILESGFVTEVVVVVKEEFNDKQICSFITGIEDLNMIKLREYLLKKLPNYMIPVYYTKLEKLPLLPNGKINRKILASYEVEKNTNEQYQEPVSEIEKKLVSLWEAILRVDNIGMNDNFFFLGGNSLKAASLANMVFKEFAVDISVKEILENSTVRTMYDYIINCSKSTYESIPLAEEKEYYEASASQKRIYLIDKIEECGLSYNMPKAIKIKGRLNIQKLQDVFNKLIQRHEALRTSFHFNEDGIVQRINKISNININYFDMNKDLVKTEDVIKPFNIEEAPLYRVGLIKISEEEYILFQDMHHIIGDGISEEILNEEIVKLYNEESLEDLKNQYKDFSEWQREKIKFNNLDKQEEYWMKIFSKEIPVLNLATDYMRPIKKSFEGRSISTEIDKNLLKALNTIAESNKATLYMVLLAAFNVVISKYTGQEDIIVGTPISGRNHADVEKIVGVFINTLAMRNNPIGSITFKEFLENVKKNSLEAFENQDYQFQDLVEKLNIKRDPSRNPIFDVMFILQNMNFAKFNMKNLITEPYKIAKNVSKFDLTLTVIQLEEKLELNFEYCTKLFKEDTIVRFSKHYINVLNQIVTGMDKKIQDIDMLAEDEKLRILNEYNDTKSCYEKEKMLNTLFEEQVLRTPNKNAIIFEDNSISYLDLNRKANKLARKLKQMGVKKDTIVGLMVNRSIEMIIGIMAVLKAGGAYLPIDPTYPEDRVSYMLENSNCNLILGSGDLNKEGIDIETINIFDENVYDKDDSNLETEGDSTSLAYVIYTSGSTGKPKGVMLEHRNVNNFIQGMSKKIDFLQDENILCLTTISFDIFVLETILPLTKGLTIVLANEIQQRDPNEICKLIKYRKINILQATPSRLQIILQAQEAKESICRLNKVIVGGEAFNENILKDLDKYSYKNKLYNVYGPTETTVWSTVKDLTNSKSITIGKPIANTQVYILNKNGLCNPIGVPGEFYIAGDSLARGYLNRDDLTKERFVSNPFEKGKLMYRTGDLARWLEDGEIQFIGRVDHQIKLRGYRIELSEIEKHMIGYGGITDCACVVLKDYNNQDYIAAYYLSKEDVAINEVRKHLLKFLPEYMIPEAYCHIDKIPMTPNGKVDKKSLPEINKSQMSVETEYVEGQTDLEKKITSIWEEVLHRKSIGINDNFFELGGNSLLVVSMHNELQKICYEKVSIADVFSNPTIADLSEFIEKGQAKTLKTHIDKITFPDKFLIKDNEFNEDSPLEYKLEDEEYKQLKNISASVNSSIKNIFLSLYVYLLAEIIERDNIALQIAISKNKASQIKFNLSEVKDFTSLFNMIDNSYNRMKESYEISQVSTKKVRNNHNLVSAAFVYNLDILSKITKAFEIVLSIKEGDDYSKIILNYDSKIIKANMAEEILKLYIKLINIIIKK